MNPEEFKALVREAVTESVSQSGEVLDREELRRLMSDAVLEGMATLGIDARNPMDVQKDHQFIRELRLISEKVKQKTYLTMVALLVGAVFGAIWLGIKSMLAT